MRTRALCDLQQASSPITSSEPFGLLPLSLHLRDPSQVLRPGVRGGRGEEDRGKRKKMRENLGDPKLRSERQRYSCGLGKKSDAKIHSDGCMDTKTIGKSKM